jgi:uncharacterized UBP type Zn finger protein
MMGFSESMARNALVKSRGDINKAVMSLLNGEIFDSEENNNITQTSSNGNNTLNSKFNLQFKMIFDFCHDHVM